jgi:hypothetical protein
MARHDKRGPSGRFTPADALDTSVTPSEVSALTDVSGNPENVYKPLNGHNGRANPFLGMGDRSYRPGIPVAKPRQGTSSVFLSPATSTIATRAQKDAKIVSSYARNPADLGDDY